MIFEWDDGFTKELHVWNQMVGLTHNNVRPSKVYFNKKDIDYLTDCYVTKQLLNQIKYALK